MLQPSGDGGGVTALDHVDDPMAVQVDEHGHVAAAGVRPRRVHHRLVQPERHDALPVMGLED